MEQASIWQQKGKLVFWLKRMDIKNKLQWRNRYFFLLDLLLLAITPSLAMALRISQPVWTVISLPIVIFTVISLVIKIAVFNVTGLYRHYWRYADGSELFIIVRAVIWATLIVTIVVFGMKAADAFPEGTLPRSLPFIDAILTVMAVGLPRFGLSSLGKQPISASRSLPAGLKHKHRVLIVGAGDAGQTIAREMLTSKYVNLVPVGFVDDDPQKQGMFIHHVQVLGTRKDIPDLVVKHAIEEVVIAMAVAPGQVIRDTVKICEATGVPCKTLPGLSELINGEVEVKQLRDINIEDLLRREPLQIDDMEVAEIIEGARVLVTGAGGSIGSELCRQVIRYKPSRLIMLGHGENSLFNISNELKRISANVTLDVVVADVRDRARLETVFRRYHPNFVIHAAAHKHVPMMEDNIEDAVTTNVMGTQNVVSVAEAYGVERLVYISTDKAVDPANVMGATKRFGESIVKQAGSRTGRPYLSVRFGNVLGSRGSVVPFFQRQIMRGGPVTVTHPDVTRYFMTIPEAVQLVLQAAALGTNGQVFVLNMGNPIKIVDLACDLIRLSGLKVNEDIEVVFTGLRPGEKLHERLFSDDEHPVPTKHNKILVAESSSAIEDRDHSMPPQLVEELIELARAGEEQALRERELGRPLIASSNQ